MAALPTLSNPQADQPEGAEDRKVISLWDRPNASRPQPSAADEAVARPQINARDGSLEHLTSQAWDAICQMNEPPFLFRHLDQLVRLEHNDRGELVTKVLDQSRMRRELARIIFWYKQKMVNDFGLSKAEVHPPPAVVQNVLATPDAPLPILRRIVRVPVFAPDGTLQAVPGYHVSGQVYYAPADGFKVPEVPQNPSADDVARAKSLILDELIVDFPFTSDADRTHAVALHLLPYVRDLIDGPTPLHLIEKPTTGTGATLLAKLLSYPALGYKVEMQTAPSDDGEWERTLLSILKGVPPVLLLDNVIALTSHHLKSALTAAVLSGRVIGSSEMAQPPIRCAWIATGNNPAMDDEMARRTVRIRLDAKMEQPDIGRTFRHENIEAWEAEHRAELVWAALVMAQKWIADGKPKPTKSPRLGSFEAWSDVIGGILENAGIDGFLGNLSEFRAASDQETTDWRRLLTVWWERYEDKPVPIGNLYALNDEIDAVNVPTTNVQGRTKRFGHMVKAKRDRLYSISANDALLEVVIEPVEARFGNARQWRLAVHKP